MTSAYSPWGPQPLRTDRVARHELGGSERAFSVPFLPFEVEPFQPDEPRRYEDECSDGATHELGKTSHELGIFSQGRTSDV